MDGIHARTIACWHWLRRHDVRWRASMDRRYAERRRRDWGWWIWRARQDSCPFASSRRVRCDVPEDCRAQPPREARRARQDSNLRPPA